MGVDFVNVEAEGLAGEHVDFSFGGNRRKVVRSLDEETIEVAGASFRRSLGAAPLEGEAAGACSTTRAPCGTPSTGRSASSSRAASR